MSMTVERAIEEVRFNMSHNGLGARAARRVKEAKEMAILALEQVQKYRTIGTVSEFRELKEKATAKKPLYSDFDENEDEEIIPYKAVCPACGYEFEFGTWNDEQNHHCECGQRMLWD